jgi:hypothetical protein
LNIYRIYNYIISDTGKKSFLILQQKKVLEDFARSKIHLGRFLAIRSAIFMAGIYLRGSTSFGQKHVSQQAF